MANLLTKANIVLILGGIMSRLEMKTRIRKNIVNGFLPKYFNPKMQAI